MQRMGRYILMKKWKIVSIVMVLVLGMSCLCGCKKNTETTHESTSDDMTEEDDAYKIGFSVIDMENPYFITLENATREYLEEQGCTMITKDPGTDQYLQSKQILEFVEEGVDAVILTPVNWEEITSSLKILKDNGISEIDWKL